MSRNRRVVTSRQLRVNELARRVLCELLARNQPYGSVLAPGAVTITAVEASPDLRQAKVYFLVHTGCDQEKTATALKHYSTYLQSRLAQQLQRKYALKLRFIADSSLEEAEKINRILSEIHQQKEQQTMDSPTQMPGIQPELAPKAF